MRPGLVGGCAGAGMLVGWHLAVVGRGEDSAYDADLAAHAALDGGDGRVHRAHRHQRHRTLRTLHHTPVVSVRACVRACVGACVGACVRVCVCACVRGCVCPRLTGSLSVPLKKCEYMETSLFLITGILYCDCSGPDRCQDPKPSNL